MRREYPEAPIIGVGAVILHQGKVLLIQRGKEPLKGEWSIPGGALELGETLQEGIQREVLEETGLEVKPLRIIEVLDRIAHDENGAVRFHYVLVDFLCRLTGGELRCSSDAISAEWASREQLNSHGKYRIPSFTVAVLEKAFRSTEEHP